MSETLFVRLPPGATPGCALEWVLLDASGARMAAGTHRGNAAAAAAEWVGDAATAEVAAEATLPVEPALPLGHRLVAFVPASEVSIAAVELPARSASKALQLAPFALEEQLAGDIDELHFAAGPQEDSGKTPFIVCTRAAMERWLEVLQSAGLSPAAVVPDLLAVPANPGHTVLWLEAGQVTVRAPGQWPMLLDAEPLDAALELAGVLGAPAQPHLLVYAAEALPESTQVALEAVGAQVASLRTQELADGALAALAVSALHEPPVSLLQGAYVSRGASTGGLARWRVPLALAAALVALALGGQVLDLTRARAESKRLDGLIADVAHQAMPDVQKLVDPRRQVEAKLAQTKGRVGADPLMTTLAALAAARDATPTLELDNVTYYDGTADLQVKAADANALEQVRTGLESSGYTAQLQIMPGNASGPPAARMRLSREGATP